MKAVLVLEDGTVLEGIGFGAEGERIGEVIFNTGVVGYQELLTDPANASKILVLTYPLIGNYGCVPKFNASKGVWVEGLIIKEKSRIFSNWQAKSSFDDFVKEYNLLTIQEVDTCSLIAHLRQKGEIFGIVSTNNFEPKILLKKIAERRKERKVSLLPKISVNKPRYSGKARAKSKKIAILDLGVTKNIIRQLETLGLSVLLLPYGTTYSEILRLKVRGLIISNGPEEDVGLNEVVANIKPLLKKLPILGISTGHQILARALGARIVKMKLGHHGSNYPVSRPGSYKGEITVQNHSYVVETESLKRIKEIEITGYNLNDRTVEEMEGKKLKLMGVQYYPVSPGFNEVNPVLKRFVHGLQ